MQAAEIAVDAITWKSRSVTPVSYNLYITYGLHITLQAINEIFTLALSLLLSETNDTKWLDSYGMYFLRDHKMLVELGGRIFSSL